MKRDKLRQIAATVLTAALLLALAACGGTKPETEETDTDEALISSLRAKSSAVEAREGDLLTRVRESGKLVIATEGNWAPWTYHDENDNLVGLDVEIGRLIALGLGVEPEFAETDWDSILAGVSSGRFDIACNGVDWTEERAESFNFSTPYIYTQEVLVVPADNEDIHSIEDLAGRKTSNSPNSTYAEIAEEAGAELVYVNTLAETIMVLERGDADATINAKVSIEEYLRQHPDAPIKIVYESEGTSVCFPTAKSEDTETFVEAVNAVLEGLRESGKLGEISEKYFGVDMTRRA